MKNSIIITTYGNHLNDYLRPCIDSIAKYTTLDDTEIIVVANGCDIAVKTYVESLGTRFRLIWFDEGIGYTKAVNAGLRVATGTYAILLNDDTALIDQPKDAWINVLRDPFDKDKKVGITGPVKFTWDCGGIKRTALAFWCVMIKRSLICELGFLDEVFNPGMGEDGDYCIKAELIGYKLVQVPIDEARAFGTGVDAKFPIYHKGNGTFGEVAEKKNEVVARNTKILADRYASRLERIYNTCLSHECDINKLFPALRKHAIRCSHITEFGVRGVFSTYALLSAKPVTMRSYDIYTSPNIKEAIEVAAENSVDFAFIEKSTLETTIEETDLLFIDTLHTYGQLSKELKIHESKVRKYILMHDTESWGTKDEIKQEGSTKEGLMTAVEDFLLENKQWKIKEVTRESNGLTVLERVPKYSIVIPTHNRKDTLEQCLTRVFAHTSLVDKEIMIVPNGCTDGTLEYLDSIRKKIRILNMPETVGQVIPAKEGVRRAKGEFVVLLDDDCYLLEQSVDTWINLLAAPFVNSKIGMSGVFAADYPYLGKAMHNGCTMFRKSMWERIGGFDDIFGYGYLYDTDFSLRVRKEGYELANVGEGGKFPIYHPDSPVTTETKQQKVSLIRKNREILYRRHGMKPKYSIVVPTYNHLEDCLKPCLEGVKKYTNLDEVEVIVVANGCKDATDKYVDSLGHPFKLLWFDEGLGFTKATNEGIKVAQGDYIILLNNDTVLLEQQNNTWIRMLEEPFLVDSKTGITGPLMLFDRYANSDVMIFFCVMIKKELFDKLGLLDEIFSPGGGEDIDFCVKALRAGYTQKSVPDNNLVKSFTNVGKFPIYHKGEGTFSEAEWPEYGKKIIKDNGLVNMLRYNKRIKLNIGSGGVEVPGYISVDKYDYRANVIMDVFDLSKNFPENSVEEILASHLFEHVNPYKAVDLLKSWLKILKPGGKLIMELPNIEELCKNFVNADKQGRYGVLNGIYGAVNTQDTEDNSKGVITSPHLWGWYPEMMQDHLIWAGFSNIIFGPEQIPHPYKNFRVEAVKPVIFRDAVENFIYDMVAPGDRVLDLGCGDKGRTKFLARNNEVISVDAWEKAKPDVLLDLEKESIPFPENSFDVVLMIDFIEHMSKTEGMRVISEAIKVCRKKVILFTPSFWTDNMENVNNPELWCYQNQYDSHKSLWALEDFAGWQPIPYPNKDCLLMMWNKK